MVKRVARDVHFRATFLRTDFMVLLYTATPRLVLKFEEDVGYCRLMRSPVKNDKTAVEGVIGAHNLGADMSQAAAQHL